GWSRPTPTKACGRGSCSASFPSAHLMQVACLCGVVPRQFTERLAIGRRAHGLQQCLNPGVLFPPGGEAEVISLLADAEEVQPGLLADQAEADARVGAAAPDSLGDASVVRRQETRHHPPPAQQLIEALPRPRAILATDPAEFRAHRGADGRE